MGRSAAGCETRVHELRVPLGCSLLEQDCGDGKACNFNARRGGLCGLTNGGMRDEPCDASADCAPGLACSPNDAGTAAACEPYCNPDETAADACGTQCNWWSLMDENAVVVAGVCQAP